MRHRKIVYVPVDARDAVLLDEVQPDEHVCVIFMDASTRLLSADASTKQRTIVSGALAFTFCAVAAAAS